MKWEVRVLGSLSLLSINELYYVHLHAPQTPNNVALNGQFNSKMSVVGKFL